MKRTIVCIMSIALICTLTLPLQAQNKQVRFGVFSDPVNKFFLQVPQGWLPADQKNDIVVFIIVETPDNKPVNSVNVQKIPVSFPDEPQPKEAIDLLAQNILNNLATAEGFQIGGDNYYTINNKTVRIIDTKYNYEGAILRQAQGILYDNGFVYAVIYTADDTVFNEEIFNKAINTFKIIK